MQSVGAQSVPTRRPQRVAIIDMDRRVRGAMAELLQAGGADVVGTSADATETLALLERGIDILVVDPKLPDLAAGEALVRRVARDWPRVRVVLIGWSDAGDSRLNETHAAYVPKSANADEFAATILAICGC